MKETDQWEGGILQACFFMLCGRTGICRKNGERKEEAAGEHDTIEIYG